MTTDHLLIRVLEYEANHKKSSTLAATLTLIYGDILAAHEKALHWVHRIDPNDEVSTDIQYQYLAEQELKLAIARLKSAAQNAPSHGFYSSSAIIDEIARLELYLSDDVQQAAKTCLEAIEKGISNTADQLKIRHTLDVALALSGDHRTRITLAEQQVTPHYLHLWAIDAAWCILAEPQRALKLVERFDETKIQGQLVFHEIALATSNSKLLRQSLQQRLIIHQKWLNDLPSDGPHLADGLAIGINLALRLTEIYSKNNEKERAEALVQWISETFEKHGNILNDALHHELLFELKLKIAINNRDFTQLAEVYKERAETTHIEAIKDLYLMRSATLLFLIRNEHSELDKLLALDLLAKDNSSNDELLTLDLDDIEISGALDAIKTGIDQGFDIHEDQILQSLPTEDSVPQPATELALPAITSDMLNFSKTQHSVKEKDADSALSTKQPSDHRIPFSIRDDRDGLLYELRTLQQGQKKKLYQAYIELAEVSNERNHDFLRRAALLAIALNEPIDHCEALRRRSIEHSNDLFAQADLHRLLRRKLEKDTTSDRFDTFNNFYFHRGNHRQGEIASFWLSLQAITCLLFDKNVEAEGFAKQSLASLEDDFSALVVLWTLNPKNVDTINRLLKHSLSRKTEEFMFEIIEQALSDINERQIILQDILKLSPQTIPAQRLLAEAYHKSGQPELALTKYQHIHPQLSTAQDKAKNLATIATIYHSDLKNAKEAEESFCLAFREDHTNEEIIKSLVSFYGSQNDIEKAIELIEETIDRAENNEIRSVLHRHRGLAYHYGGETDYAIAALSASIDLNPLGEASINTLFQICEESNQLQRFIAICSDLVHTQCVAIHQAEAYKLLGQFDHFIDIKLSLYQQESKALIKANIAYEIGEAYHKNTQYEKAMEWYSLSTESLPEHNLALRALRSILNKQGLELPRDQFSEEALANLESIAEKEERLLAQAKDSEDQGNHDQAISYLNEAYSLGASSDELYDALQRNFRRLNRPLDVAKTLIVRSELHQGSIRSEYLFRAANLYAEQNKIKHAKEAYRNAIFANNDDRDIFTHAEVFFYSNELWHESLEIYDHILDACENEGLRTYRISDLYIRKGQVQFKHLGQLEDATTSFFHAMKFDPTNETVISALTEIYILQEDWRGLIGTFEFRASLLPENESFRIESLRQAARIATTRLSASSVEAQRLWENIILLDPANNEALDALTTIYKTNEDYHHLADNISAKIAFEPDFSLAEQLKLELAEIYEKNLENLLQAAHIYKDILSANEHHEIALHALARIHEALGNWEECIRVLQGLIMIEGDPDERSLLYFKCGSITEARFNDSNQAIDFYQHSLEENPASLPALHSIRDIHLKAKNWELVLETLDDELAIWDDNKEQAGIFARKGEILLKRLNAVDQALGFFEKALKLDPDSQLALQSLFDYSLEINDTLRAQRLAERLAPRMNNVSDPKKRSDFFTKNGKLLLDSKKHAAAAESFSLALESNPSNQDALDALVALSKSTPDVYPFGELFRSLEQKFRSAKDLKGLGRVLVVAGSFAEANGEAIYALDIYRQAQSIHPHHVEAIKAETNLLFALNQKNEAISKLHSLLEQEPDPVFRSKIYQILGDSFSEIFDDHEKASLAYFRAIESDPKAINIRIHLALEYLVLERYTDAKNIIFDLFAHGSDDHKVISELYQILATIEHRQGSIDEAYQAYSQALATDPTAKWAALGFSGLLIEAHDFKKASQVLTKAATEIATSGSLFHTIELRRKLAECFAAENNIDAAINEYRSIVNSFNNEEDRILLSDLYSRQPGGISQSIAELKKGIKDQNFTPLLLETLASRYEANGDQLQALIQLRALEALDRSDQLRHERLMQLERAFPFFPRRAIDEKLRRQLLPQLDKEDPFEKIWQLIFPALKKIFQFPIKDVKALELAPDSTLSNDIRLCLQLFGEELQLFEANLHKPMWYADPQRLIVDKSLIHHDKIIHSAHIRFCVGKTLGYKIQGHTILSQLDYADKQLIVELIDGLLTHPLERSDLALEFIKRLDREVIQTIDQLAEQYALSPTPLFASQWLTHSESLANIYGLIASDNLTLALEALKMQSAHGSSLETDPAIQTINGGQQLLDFYLSDEYFSLRRKLHGR